MVEISQNTKLEIAVEIIAAKIAKCSIDGYRTKDDEIRNLLKEKKDISKYVPKETLNALNNIHFTEDYFHYLKYKITYNLYKLHILHLHNVFYSSLLYADHEIWLNYTGYIYHIYTPHTSNKTPVI